MRIYVDTNIYLDYLEERSNIVGKDLSAPAYRLFARTIACEFQIILSDAVLLELRKHIEAERTAALFVALQKKLIPIKTSIEDEQQAQELGTHDAIHIILARKASAACVVTRNVKDFSGRIDAKLPEDI